LVQPCGSVTALHNRVIAYPYLYRCRLARAALSDCTKPGRVRFLRIHLVDPSRRLPSTSQVAPQQASWLQHQLHSDGRQNALGWKLPSEVLWKVLETLPSVQADSEAERVRREVVVPELVHKRAVAKRTRILEPSR
jgi:hypothetical protein